jgi:hypothetical protein
VGYDGEGAMRISAAGFVTYDEQDGLPTGQVTSITPGRNGRPVVTTGTRPGLEAYQLENERFVRQELGVAAGCFPESWRPWHQVLAENGSDYVMDYVEPRPAPFHNAPGERQSKADLGVWNA